MNTVPDSLPAEQPPSVPQGSTPRPSVADRALEQLAYEETLLRERILSLEGDVDTYRAIAVTGIHVAHDLTRQRDAARAQLAALREEYRAFRARMLADGGTFVNTSRHSHRRRVRSR
jgi:hypothetical protein